MNGLSVVLFITFVVTSFSQPQADKLSRDDAVRFQKFEKQVDHFRELLKIPGLSVAIVKDQKLVWTRGFGSADVENKIPATPDTLYHLASVTKTFASILIMQLVEQGKLDLNEPMSDYSTDFNDDSVKIKHIITHTSEGTPGEKFQYNGNRYDYLTAVIEKKFGKRFGELIVEKFFEPLGMSGSVPYNDIVKDSDKWKTALGQEKIDRYKKNLTNFAQPYTYYGAGETVHTDYPYPESLGAAAGMLSTVVDLAKYDIAIDKHVLLRKEAQEKAWTPFVSNSGKRLPYGLGWFVMNYHGTRLVWHTGDWGQGFSAYFFKVPEKNLTLIMLANSEALVEHQYSIGEAMVDDAVRNSFVCGFLSVWEIGPSCEKTAEAAVSKFIEERRASGKVAIKADPAILETYVGQYQFDERLGNRIYTVTRQGDRLFLQSTGGKGTLLFAESNSKFFLKDRTWWLHLRTVEGQPPQLDIIERNNTYTSKKIK